MRIIFATHNKNKMIEVRQILGDVATEIVAKSELGIDPSRPERPLRKTQS